MLSTVSSKRPKKTDAEMYVITPMTTRGDTMYDTSSISWVMYFIMQQQLKQLSTTRLSLLIKMNALARKLAHENLRQCLKFKRKSFLAEVQKSSFDTAMFRICMGRGSVRAASQGILAQASSLGIVVTRMEWNVDESSGMLMVIYTKENQKMAS